MVYVRSRYISHSQIKWRLFGHLYIEKIFKIKDSIAILLSWNHPLVLTRFNYYNYDYIQLKLPQSHKKTMAHKNVRRDLVIKLIIHVTTWLAIFAQPANAFCPHLCHCDDLRMIVTCPQESKLDVIPITLNPNLRELHLKENKIRTVDASFQFYGQLVYVDFSENEMSHLPQRCFASQKKLLKLKMDGNKIANITNATFVGLKSMTSISLRDNLLSSLQENLFVFLSKVSYPKNCLIIKSVFISSNLWGTRYLLNYIFL